MKYKFKIDDPIIGIKDDIIYPHIKIIGKIGRITEVRLHDNIRPYKVVFYSKVGDRGYNSNTTVLRENEIKSINKLKLKKLLGGT